MIAPKIIRLKDRGLRKSENRRSRGASGRGCRQDIITICLYRHYKTRCDKELHLSRTSNGQGIGWRCKDGNYGVCKIVVIGARKIKKRQKVLGACRGMWPAMDVTDSQVIACRMRMFVVQAETYRTTVIVMVVLGQRCGADQQHDAERQYDTQILFHRGNGILRMLVQI